MYVAKFVPEDGMGEFWIQLWNKLLTNKKAANPTSPSSKSRLWPPPPSFLIQTRGFNPRFLALGKKKCPSIFVRGLHPCFLEHYVNLFTRVDDKLKNERLVVLDAQRQSTVEQTIIHWRSWLKWLNSSHPAVFLMARRINKTQDFFSLLFSIFILHFSFLFEFSHLQLKDI